MNDKETRIQEVVASSREVTNSLLKELKALKKEADEGDRFSLDLYSLWKVV